MSLEGSDQAGVIAVGAAGFLAFGAALYKSASMRSNTSSRWSSRVDLAVVALDEKTVAELRVLRDEIDEVLPEAGALFDPRQAIVDPSPLSERVERTADYYSARVRMQKYLNRLLWLGRVGVGGFALLALAVIALTLHYAELYGWGWLPWIGLVLGGVGGTTVIAACGVYVVCEDRLATDEILAGTAAQATGGGAQ